MKVIFVLLFSLLCGISHAQNDQQMRAPIFPNVIAFDYDAAGNQILRNFIHVTSGVYKTAPQTNEITDAQLLESDIYEDIKYYPNPVVSELFVKWKNSATNHVAHIELYSMTGQSLKRYVLANKEEESTIDFQGLPLGFYNLVLVYASGDQKNLRIVKK